MDDQVTTTYCLIDDFLRAVGHREPSRRAVSDAEVLTVAVAAARTFRGNSEAAWRFLTEYGYMSDRLSRGQFGRASARPRRLHAAAPLAERLFEALAEVWRTTGSERAFAIDSMPGSSAIRPCCDNARIDRSKLYPLADTDGAFRGYQSSKRRYFYGVKIHAVVNEHRQPVEVRLTPGSHNDTGELKHFDRDLPSGSAVYGDNAYADYVHGLGSRHHPSTPPTGGGVRDHGTGDQVMP